MAEPPILHKLRERGWQEGKNARCPAAGHEKKRGDINPSLGVTVERDRVLLHCYAGCRIEDVVAALGCTKRDLFSPDGSTGSARLTETRFDVRDANGNLLGIKVRLDFPDDRPKCFYWRGPDGKKADPPIRSREMPLLGAELLRERPDESVVLVEGELKALDLRAAGVLALGTVTGSGCVPADEVLSDLQDRKVILWPDSDESGRKHMRAIGRALLRLGTVTVWWLTWPGAKPGNDAADFVAARRREGNNKAQIEEDVLALLATAEEFDAERGVDEEPAEPIGDFTPASLRPYRSFPVERLPRTFRRFVDTSALSIGVDPAYVALPLLGAAAGAIGASRSIALKSTWIEPCVLWPVVVGESGSGKTPGLDRALEPLRDIQTRLLAEHDYARREFDTQRAEAKAKGGDVPESERPRPRRLLVSDCTVEALSVLLRDNPRGLTLDRDELSGWVGSFDAYKNGSADSSFWLSLYRAQPVAVDRKTSPDPILVPRPHLSIVGTVQPGVLRRLLGKRNRENGLAARLLLAMPPRRPRRWTNAAPISASDDVRDVFGKLLALVEDDDGRPLALPLDPEAENAWVEFFNAHALVVDSLSGDLAALASKIEAAAARLALIVHVVRCAQGDSIDSTCIDAESMGAGIALARWFFEEGCRVYGVLDEDANQHQLREDVEFVRRKGGAISAREFNRGRRSVKTSDEARERLDAIARAGLGRWVDCPPGEEGGRPTERLALSDYVDETTKPKPPTEDGGVDETTKPNRSRVSGFVDPSTGGEDETEAET